MPPALDSEKKTSSKNLMERFCIKAEEVENTNFSNFDFETGILGMDIAQGHSDNPIKAMKGPVQPCLPPKVTWIWGLLHDSTSETFEHEMQVFGDTSKGLNDDKHIPKFENENDRLIFYNNQNLLVSERNEKNAEVDKLISKFDANVEDIWKTTPEPDYLQNVKYQTFFSQSFFPNPFIHGSNVIWAFEEKKAEGETSRLCQEKKEIFETDSPKFTPPRSSCSQSTFLGAFGFDGSDAKRRPGENVAREIVPAGKTAGENYHLDPEEEDLLISAKTHFRPIRAEDNVGSQAGTYADGTTFAISNDLEKVSFKRSESGALYLEADADTPRKYMEYKEKETGNNAKGDWESDDSSAEEFVPKFRVRQSNEKCCQTDEIDDEQVVPSLNKSDCESTSYESEEDEFYFPGDDELAQNIINVIDEEVEKEKNEMNVDHYRDWLDGGTELLEMSLCKTAEVKENSCSCGKNWDRDATEYRSQKQEWRDIWNSDIVCNRCRTNPNKLSRKDEFRFREELTQEGEQLLMDLSSLQQMYSASDLAEEETRINGLSLTPESTCKGGWWSYLIAKEEPARNHFEFRSFGVEDKIFSKLTKNEKNKSNGIDERPPAADLIRTERRRRNSSSQKACNLYLEGGCRRPYCRFAHCDSAIPCPFFADSSCTKGESCPLSHSARRPLSL